MSKLVGVVPSADPESPYAIVEISSVGVELQCDSSFVLKPEGALAFATLLIQAAQGRVEKEHELAGEIKDPEKLVALIPSDPDSTRVIRRRRTS